MSTDELEHLLGRRVLQGALLPVFVRFRHIDLAKGPLVERGGGGGIEHAVGVVAREIR